MRLHDTKKNGTVTPVRSSPRPPPPAPIFYWVYLASRLKKNVFVSLQSLRTRYDSDRTGGGEYTRELHKKHIKICKGLFTVESALSLSS